jgi:hypothetical protein
MKKHTHTYINIIFWLILENIKKITRARTHTHTYTFTTQHLEELTYRDRTQISWLLHFNFNQFYASVGKNILITSSFI